MMMDKIKENNKKSKITLIDCFFFITSILLAIEVNVWLNTL